MKTTTTHWRRVLVVAAVMIVAAIWRYEQSSEAAPDTIAHARRGATTAASQAPLAAETPTQRPEAGPAERALDLAALRRALSGRSDAEAQVQRVIAFARFRDLVGEYGSGKDRMSAAERMRLARRILSELPEHVASKEILPLQAEAMTATLLNDAEPDPLARSDELAASRRQWDAYAAQTVGPSPAQDARYLAYAQRSRAIFQEVQATIPDSAQQQRVIAQRLQALRVELFDHAASSDTH